MNKTILLTHSGDKNRWIWPYWYHCLKENWCFDAGIDTVFLGEKIKPNYTELNASFTTGAIPWADGLIEYLKTNCHAEYVLYTLEDCLLIRKADIPGILAMVETMKKYDIKLIKLYTNRNLVPFVAANVREHELIKCSPDMPFSCSFFPSIWHKDLLLSVLREGENPWVSERRGSGRMQRAGVVPYYSPVELYPFREVIRRGKLKLSAKRFIRNLHIKPEIRRIFHYKPKPLSDNAGEMLKDVVSKLKCHYWLSAGTALGLYRDHDLLSGDTDIDIAVVGYKGIEKDLQAWLTDYKLFRYATHSFNTMQMAFVKDDVCIDVYIYWTDKHWLINVGEYGRVIFPGDMLRNTVAMATKYGALNMPNPPEEYLRIKFGDDWMIPQQKKGRYERI
jgi:hypothetical protein